MTALTFQWPIFAARRHQRRHTKPGAGTNHQKWRMISCGAVKQQHVAIRRRIRLGKRLCSEVIDDQQLFELQRLGKCGLGK